MAYRNTTPQNIPTASPYYDPNYGRMPNAQYVQAPPPNMAGGVLPVTHVDAQTYADGTYDKSERRRGGWSVLFFIALLVLLLALGAVGYIIYTYWHGQSEYDDLAEYMTIQNESGVHTLADFDVDWDALQAINSDVVGWIYVPDTIINYPIVWREHDDAYYLKHNFGGTSVGEFGAEYGCVMLSGENSPEWTDQVNIIYGHNMRNGSMFAELGNLDSESFNEHRTIYVLTPVGNFRMTSFARDKIIGTSTDIVIPNFPTQTEFREYVQARLDQSRVIANPPAPSASQIEQVFALSTCSEPDNDYRIITFCSVDEFLPAGSDSTRGNALISDSDLESVASSTSERVIAES